MVKGRAIIIDEEMSVLWRQFMPQHRTDSVEMTHAHVGVARDQQQPKGWGYIGLPNPLYHPPPLP
jgi:hypothetical protein